MSRDLKAEAVKARRELARLIMEAAIEKVENLGFSLLIRENDAANNSTRGTKRHHVKINRLDFIFTDQAAR